MLWLLESDIFGESHPLLEPALAQGHNVILDGFESVRSIAPSIKGPTMFHGSMANARRFAGMGKARCGDQHTAMYVISTLGELALNHGAVKTTVREIVHMPYLIARALGTEDVFVRPDSPLKQFSGRTITLDAGVMVDDFDLGYYYDDVDLPIIVAPKKKIIREWRFIMAGAYPITGSEYDPRARKGVGRNESFDVLTFACSVAKQLANSDHFIALDVGETDEGLRVIETNPFSASDLYDCDLAEIVQIVSREMVKAVLGKPQL